SAVAEDRAVETLVGRLDLADAPHSAGPGDVSQLDDAPGAVPRVDRRRPPGAVRRAVHQRRGIRGGPVPAAPAGHPQPAPPVRGEPAGQPPAGDVLATPRPPVPVGQDGLLLAPVVPRAEVPRGFRTGTQ